MTKSYDELTFSDDFMFCRVLTKRPEICCLLAELITGKKSAHIRTLNGQQQLKIRSDGRGVRFDVFFEDEQRIFDFEMQTAIKAGYEKRARYYQSMIDSNFLDQGINYVDLKESYVVFFCMDDPFGKNRLRYSFVHRDEDDPSLVFNDFVHVVFLCADRKLLLKHGYISDELYHFLCYIAGVEKVPQTELTRMIQKEVENQIADEDGRKVYMTLKEKLEEERTQGKAEEKTETGKRLIAMGSDDEFISKATGLSLSQVKAIREAK